MTHTDLRKKNMLINYPLEWEKYMVEGKVRTFSDTTPKHIIGKAKKINEQAVECEGKPYFYFDEKIKNGGRHKEK